MNPEYVAKKTAWRAITPLRILLIWLIIPLIIIIVHIILLKNEIIEFYSDKVIYKRGILSKKENHSAFTGVMGVSVNKSLFGRIFNYGDVHIDIAGRWDINTEGIKNPGSLQRYLEGRLVKVNTNAVNTLIG